MTESYKEENNDQKTADQRTAEKLKISVKSELEKLLSSPLLPEDFKNQLAHIISGE